MTGPVRRREVGVGARALLRFALAALAGCAAHTDTPPAHHAGDPPPRPACAIEHLSSATTAIGLTLHHHDGAGRVVATEHDDDGDGQLDRALRYTYDRAGDLVATDDGERVQRLERDGAGRVVARVLEHGGRVVARTTLTYDDAGRVIREADWLLEVRYQYDRHGRLVREQRREPGGALHADLVTSYDGFGLRIARDGFDETGRIHETWDHDRAGREIGSELTRDGVRVLITRITFDRAGRAIAEDYADGDAQPSGGRTWTYDAGGRLVAEETRDRLGAWTRNRFLYDCDDTVVRPLAAP